MKPRIMMWSIAATLLAALAMPIGMAAQDASTPNHPRHHTYRLIDLGTLGGPASYSGDGGVGVRYLNNSGVVTGTADTPAPDPYAPNCSWPDCQLAHAFRWQHGTLTDLGALPGTNGSVGTGINDYGWITGDSQTGIVDPLLGPASDPVLWTGHQIIDLGTFGGPLGTGVCVNNHGQVAGFALNTIPDDFSGFGTQLRAFLWENGQKRDVGTLGTGTSISIFFGNTCLNEPGHLIGASFTSQVPNPDTGIPTVDPFLWIRGRMMDLGGLGGTIGAPQALNEHDQVVGLSDLAGDLSTHPFLWNRGSMIDLGTFGGSNGQATGINDAGDVIGEADFPGDAVHDAFLWRHGSLIDLGNLGRTSFPDAVNNRGEVVGASRVDASNVRAFISVNGEYVVDLNDLIPQNSSLTLVYALNINEQGTIAGTGAPTGCAPDGNEACLHAYLLIPNGECDGSCEQRLAESQRNRDAAQQQARIQGLSNKPRAQLTPAERVRNMMQQRLHVPGARPLQRD